jgi:hypothetical protein
MKRRAFVGALGAGAVGSVVAAAEELEHARILELETAFRGRPDTPPPPGRTPRALVAEPDRLLEPMPAQPTLADFFKLRFNASSHCLQSATRALKSGCTEEQVLACLLHDTALALMPPDHGYWGHDLYAPYVSEKVAWAIRYHQALRFFPDPQHGYEYPQMYIRLFGADYKPEPYLQAAYQYARNHKWYMEARLITLNDDYSFDPSAKVSLDAFVDIVGRHFRQPKEGLGWDNTPSSHMWRTLIFPRRPL